MLQAFDRALIGGNPSEVPELMRERNPISYVDRVRVPILFGPACTTAAARSAR